MVKIFDNAIGVLGTWAYTFDKKVYPATLHLKSMHFTACRDYLNKNKLLWGFPGGSVVKNLPANAGDTSSSPGLGRSHMPRSNKAQAPQLLSLHSRAHEPQLLSPHATTTEPVHLEPMLCNKRSHRNEKPVHRNKE